MKKTARKMRFFCVFLLKSFDIRRGKVYTVLGLVKINQMFSKSKLTKR